MRVSSPEKCRTLVVVADKAVAGLERGCLPFLLLRLTMMHVGMSTASAAVSAQSSSGALPIQGYRAGPETL